MCHCEESPTKQSRGMGRRLLCKASQWHVQANGEVIPATILRESLHAVDVSGLSKNWSFLSFFQNFVQYANGIISVCTLVTLACFAGYTITMASPGHHRHSRTLRDLTQPRPFWHNPQSSEKSRAPDPQYVHAFAHKIAICAKKRTSEIFR